MMRTTDFQAVIKAVDGRHKPGHDGKCNDRTSGEAIPVGEPIPPVMAAPGAAIHVFRPVTKAADRRHKPRHDGKSARACHELQATAGETR